MYRLLYVRSAPRFKTTASAIRKCNRQNALYTFAIRRSPSIKFPVTLGIIFPTLEDPEPLEFPSYDSISDFLAPTTFLRAPRSKNIHRGNVKDIDPTKIYEILGPGFICQKRTWLSRDDWVWDKDFEEKAKLALKVKLQKGDPGLVDLPRKIYDAEGKYITEWDAIFQLSDGCIIFLETKYRITKLVSKRVILKYSHQYFTYTCVLAVRIMSSCNRTGRRIAF
jgi:hypothetical protein